MKEQEEKYNYEIEYLYNIETKEYRWYEKKIYLNSRYIYYTDIKKTYDRSDKLNNFNNVTKTDEEIGANMYYNFKEEEMTKEENSISKYEETFIKIDEEITKKMTSAVTISTDMNKSEIEDKIKENAKIFEKENDEIINEIKVATENKIAEVENKKEKMKIAAEEKARKEAEEKVKVEEEAKKKEQEQTNVKTVKAGNYTLKCGTYVGYSSGAKITHKVNENNTITTSTNPEYSYTISEALQKNIISVTSNNTYVFQVDAGVTMKYQGN